MFQKGNSIWQFGGFSVDPKEQLFLRDGLPVSVTAKTFSLLVFLLEAHGKLVEREILINHLWPDTSVEENNLKVQISVLRRILGDSAETPQFIETVPKRGYRFIAKVTRIGLDKDESQGESSPSEIPGSAFGLIKKLANQTKEGSRLFRYKGLPLIVLLLAVSALFWKGMGFPKSGSTREIHSIAVLPFTFDPKTDETTLLGIGLSELLVDQIGKIHGVTVRPVGSASNIKSAPRDPVTIGRELKVDGVIEGKVQRTGENYRISVRLVRVSGGDSIWEGVSYRSAADIFTLQDWLSEVIAKSIGAELTPGTATGTVPKPVSSEATSLYLKGRFFLGKRTREGAETALRYFQDAIRKEPEFGGAWAGVADCYLIMGDYGWQPLKASWEKARQAASRAISCDQNLAEAHAAIGYLMFFGDWVPGEAEKEFQAAIRLNPNYATAHQWYSQLLSLSGRNEEAIREAKAAVRIDPASPVMNMQLGAAFFYARQYPEAIRQLNLTLELDPAFLPALSYLGQSLEEDGNFDQAVATLNSLSGRCSEKAVRAMIAHVRAKAGDRGFCRDSLGFLTRPEREDPVNQYALALVRAGMGEKDAAIQHLEKAFGEKSSSLVYLKADPRFDSLREEERFKALIQQIWASGKQG